MLCTADDNMNDSRFKNLSGHRVICTCDRPTATGIGAKGCRQALLECDHLDCPTSKGMRQQAREMSDRLVWIVALAILAATCSIMLFVLRKQRSRAAMLATTAAQPQGIKVDALRHVSEETKEEDD
jgi:hypothetical protein